MFQVSSGVNLKPSFSSLRVRLLVVITLLSILQSPGSIVLARQSKPKPKTVNAVEMPVYYATNRERLTSRFAPIYSRKRRNQVGLEYGQCNVTIPSLGTGFNAVQDYALGWRGRTSTSSLPLVSTTKSQFQSEADFVEALRERTKDCERVVLFVHGYKSTFDGALAIGSQLGGVFHCPVVIFSWPSSEQLLGYTKDECNIEWSLPHFKKFLAAVESAVGAKKMTLVAHSMGNRLAMWSLRDRSAAARCHGQVLEQYQDVVLTSPDVDTGTFKLYASDVCENAPTTWVLTSERDNALRASKGVHERRRLGMPGPDGVDADWRQPPIIDGLHTVEFTLLDRGLVGHTIQHRLIADLAKYDKPGPGLQLVEKTDGDYRWLELKRAK